MTFSNYKYNLNNGSTYSYTKTTTTYTPAGSAGSAGSGGSTGSGGSMIATTTSQTVIIGSSSSAGMVAQVGSVGQLSFDLIVDMYTQGNLTASEVVTGLKAKGAKNVQTTKEVLNTVVTFTYQNKSYKITCRTSAANSQIDNNTSKTYSKSSLSGIPQSEINKYFDVAVEKNGVVEEYAFKFSTQMKFKTLEQFKTHIFNQYKNDLILDNFLADKNRKTDVKSDLIKTDRGILLSPAKLPALANQIKLATGEEANKLRRDALEKFVKDFSNGNLAYDQVSMILDAIGVESKKIPPKTSALYEITFEFDGKKYSVKCNKDAATSGKDSIQVDSGIMTLEESGYDEKIFNAIYEPIVEGGKLYQLRAGFTKEDLEIANELALDEKGKEGVVTEYEVRMYKLCESGADIYSDDFRNNIRTLDTATLQKAMADIELLLKSEGITVSDFNYLANLHNEAGKALEVKEVANATVDLLIRFGCEEIYAEDYNMENINFGTAFQLVSNSEDVSGDFATAYATISAILIYQDNLRLTKEQVEVLEKLKADIEQTGGENYESLASQPEIKAVLDDLRNIGTLYGKEKSELEDEFTVGSDLYRQMVEKYPNIEENALKKLFNSAVKTSTSTAEMGTITQINSFYQLMDNGAKLLDMFTKEYPVFEGSQIDLFQKSTFNMLMSAMLSSKNADAYLDTLSDIFNKENPPIDDLLKKDGALYKAAEQNDYLIVIREAILEKDLYERMFTNQEFLDFMENYDFESIDVEAEAPLQGFFKEMCEKFNLSEAEGLKLLNVMLQSYQPTTENEEGGTEGVEGGDGGGTIPSGGGGGGSSSVYTIPNWTWYKNNLDSLPDNLFLNGRRFNRVETFSSETVDVIIVSWPKDVMYYDTSTGKVYTLDLRDGSLKPTDINISSGWTTTSTWSLGRQESINMPMATARYGAAGNDNNENTSGVDFSGFAINFGMEVSDTISDVVAEGCLDEAAKSSDKFDKTVCKGFGYASKALSNGIALTGIVLDAADAYAGFSNGDYVNGTIDAIQAGLGIAAMTCTGSIGGAPVGLVLGGASILIEGGQYIYNKWDDWF